MIDDDDFRLFWDTGDFRRERKGYSAHGGSFDDTAIDEIAKQESCCGYRVVNGRRHELTLATAPADDAGSIWTEEIDRLENAFVRRMGLRKRQAAKKSRRVSPKPS